MTDVNRRSYSSPLRAEQGAASRAAVLAAAHRLFVARGYGATTIEQIAAEAGVSKPTVFTAVGNKVEVFKLVRDIAMAGDDADRTVTDRPSVSAIGEAADLADAIDAAALHLLRTNARYRTLDGVLRGASGTDAAMRDLMETAEAQRHIGAGHLLDRLCVHGALRVGHARAQDRLWLLMAPDNYARLVDARGWTQDEYRDWLIAAITELF
jgi:AcrR family transcriptional regulator